MSTISISELEKKSAGEWLKYAAQDDLIIVANGQPVAVLMQLASGSVEAAQAFVRSIRALRAQASLQQQSDKNGAANLSMEDIDAEIDSVRRERSRK